MDKLLRFDELASTSPRAIDFVGEVLLKSLRYDTKFSLLFDNSLFHKIYAIHHELAAPLISDAAHVQEVEKWKMHISRILKWLHKDHGEKQVGDIDILHQEAPRHLNTIFESLREQVEPPAGEQAAKLQHSVNVIRQEILEFRYLLGDFYRHLGQTGLEERHLRGRFVTVDNQLEAIETALQSLDPDAIRLSY